MPDSLGNCCHDCNNHVWRHHTPNCTELWSGQGLPEKVWALLGAHSHTLAVLLTDSLCCAQPHTADMHTARLTCNQACTLAMFAAPPLGLIR